MSKGDHIYFNCGGYSHHGIDCGDGTVIHYTKNQGNISRVSWDSFASGKTVFLREYGSFDLPHVVIQRAESRLGENAYNLFGNNCEHFATWCKTGIHASEQVKNAGATAGGASVSGAAVAGIGALGMAPAAITTLAMNRVLEDDENLTSEEREARAVGRTMTTVGAAAGTAGAVGAVAAYGTVAGLSATGITSGLAAVGATVGGGMAAGVAITVAAPAVAAAAVGYGAYCFWKWIPE
ncbi:NC domain protein [Nostoc sp. KVJ3]|uniref:lecithin retinol acyltransferase family protein n=1 Tax=Nostoc sp. KVJ3 TaxID=457945 RepID=UPI0022385BEE|nr:lecithin retinol acyltransferase family protein [Nostoc sp. KVJ3]MCW5315789.1 NC domain protein [Nostoc sp. KVJ3]